MYNVTTTWEMLYSSSGHTVGTEKLQDEAGTAKERLNGYHHFIGFHAVLIATKINDPYCHTAWDEAEELATDKAEWRQRVAQCIHRGV